MKSRDNGCPSVKNLLPHRNKINKQTAGSIGYAIIRHKISE